jgi:uncharacterized protein YecA (UPF0149 family)
MNTDTGKLVQVALGETTPAKHVLVRRDLTAKERADMQIRKYAPCACGSGKKFKFCCYTGGGK